MLVTCVIMTGLWLYRGMAPFKSNDISARDDLPYNLTRFKCTVHASDVCRIHTLIWNLWRRTFPNLKKIYALKICALVRCFLNLNLLWWWLFFFLFPVFAALVVSWSLRVQVLLMVAAVVKQNLLVFFIHLIELFTSLIHQLVVIMLCL